MVAGEESHTDELNGALDAIAERQNHCGGGRTTHRSDGGCIISSDTGPPLPEARGPVSEFVIDALRRSPGSIGDVAIEGVDVMADDDAQLALSCCYELHYESFDGVDDAWEWNPDLLRVTAKIEHRFAEALHCSIGPIDPLPPEDVVPALRDLAAAGTGPSLSAFMAERGTIDNFREFCVHRSSYQLKEADPHTWMIPRLRGVAKAAAVTIQHDEYGEGEAEAMHASLFARTMDAFGLDSTYGAYLDVLPAATLATGNLVTMFGLHRRWRAACVGHLALFEMTSVRPMSRYVEALRRLGVGEDAHRFYEVHVAADAWHEQVAEHKLVGGLLAADPRSGADIVFGAGALMEVERRMAEGLMTAWAHGKTSLRDPYGPHAAAA